ncbi:MAG: regulator of CtrA degradation, partial [Alphaproteobacteria bacterium]|nr:regulator of CtrA degradation [Alphaproteobacteria bacterium]
LAVGETADEQTMRLLPERLRALIERSKALQTSIRRLDATIHATPDASRARPGNPVERQLGLLKAAFERE